MVINALADAAESACDAVDDVFVARLADGVRLGGDEDVDTAAHGLGCEPLAHHWEALVGSGPEPALAETAGPAAVDAVVFVNFIGNPAEAADVLNESFDGVVGGLIGASTRVSSVWKGSGSMERGRYAILSGC